MKREFKSTLSTHLVRCAAVLVLILIVASWANVFAQSNSQGETDIPNDITLAYVKTDSGKFAPLPLEDIVTKLPLPLDAKTTKTGRLEIKNASAQTILRDTKPVFFIFVRVNFDPPPHFLVRLEPTGNCRRINATSAPGNRTFIADFDDVIRVEYRLVEKIPVKNSSGMIFYVYFMAVRPTSPLVDGEYALLGSNLLQMATFRIQQ
jgi:hypothetical protein